MYLQKYVRLIWCQTQELYSNRDAALPHSEFGSFLMPVSSHGMIYQVVLKKWLIFTKLNLTYSPGPDFNIASDLLKLSELWDASFSFKHFKQMHFLSQYFENLLKQGA